MFAAFLLSVAAADDPFSMVEAAQTGVQVCIAHSTVTYANEGRDAFAAVDRAILSCGDDIARLKDIYRLYTQKNFKPPPPLYQVDLAVDDFVIEFRTVVLDVRKLQREKGR